MLKIFAFFTLLATFSVGAYAQTVTKQNEVTASVTITAIDQATRSVTLRAENGVVDTFTVGPAVKRFNELKVGDTIRATYTESLVLQLRKPGDAAVPSSATTAAGRLEKTPGGIIGTQETVTVTVKAVDMTVPSLTVVTPAGLTLTRKIADKKNLEGVAPGDRIEITYTQGLLVAAEPSKK
jgi:Cu/Ag efflux protein CusF